MLSHSLEAALRLDPDSLDAMHWLAIAEHRSGQDDSARSRVESILKRDPRFLAAIDDEMQFAVDRKDFRTALLAQLTRVAVMHDPPASEYCRLGVIWVTMSNLTEAESSSAQRNSKGSLQLRMPRRTRGTVLADRPTPLARENFEWVVRFFPTADATIFRSLAGVDVALGDTKSAHSALRKGRRLFPDDRRIAKSRGSLAPVIPDAMAKPLRGPGLRLR